MKPGPREVNLSLAVGQVAVSLIVQDVAWTPDVADDMKNRGLEMLEAAVDIAVKNGVLMTDGTVVFNDGTEEAE